MKLKRLLILMVVPLLAAMGDRPAEQGEADGHRPFVRGEVPAASSEAKPMTLTRPEGELPVVPAAEVEPAEFLWQARPLVVFADTAADPDFDTQLAQLRRDPAPLLARDVVVVTDTDPAAASVWRRQLRPEGFTVVLMDKDGQIKQRMPSPRSVREISRAIDKFPLRRREIGGRDALP